MGNLTNDKSCPKTAMLSFGAPKEPFVTPKVLAGKITEYFCGEQYIDIT